MRRFICVYTQSTCDCPLIISCFIDSSFHIRGFNLHANAKNYHIEVIFTIYLTKQSLIISESAHTHYKNRTWNIPNVLKQSFKISLRSPRAPAGRKLYSPKQSRTQSLDSKKGSKKLKQNEKF